MGWGASFGVSERCAMKAFLGYVLYDTRRSPGIRRPCHWMKAEAHHFYYRLSDKLICLRFHPRKGTYPLQLLRVVGHWQEEVSTYPDLRSKFLKRITSGGEVGVPLPKLSGESKVLVRFPRLREFLTDNKYDDGSPRLPGRLWLDQDGVAFTVTLFEPSAMVRFRARASTLDDAFTLAEAHLSAENPPWELDQWAMQRQGKKKGK